MFDMNAASHAQQSGGIGTRRGRLAGTAVALALLVAGCGGNSDVAGSTSGTEEEVPATVRLGIGGSGTLAYAASYVAEGKGYLDEELKQLGSKVEVIGLSGSVDGIKALATGDVQYTTSVTSNGLNSNAEGAPVQQVVQFLNTDLTLLAATPGLSTDFNDHKALVEGKRWGIPSIGSSAQVTALRLLKKWGYSEKDVEFVVTGNVAASVAAVTKKIADYYWIGSAAQPLIEDGTLDLVLNLYEPEAVTAVYGGPYASAGLFVKPEYAAEHPKLTEAVVRAHVRALQFIQENKSNPEAINASFPKDMQSPKNIGVLKATLAGFSPDGRVLQDAVERVVESGKGGGLFKEDQEFDLKAFVNNSFLE
jgi:NitT/TauT family transport system substrate-binding protein